MMPAQSASRGGRLDAGWVASTLANWAIITAAIAYSCHLANWASYILAAFVIGTRQHALAVLGHHAAHFHVSRIKRLNDLLANLFVAWPIGYSLSGYRCSHFEHHRTVGSEGDPELALSRVFPKKWSADASRPWLFFTDLLGFGSYELLLLWHDLMRWQPQTPTWRRIEEYVGLGFWRIGAVVLIALIFGWSASLTAVVLWYGALSTSFFGTYRLRCLHAAIARTERYGGGQPALWRRLLYLPANSWLLCEHYAWPNIPLRHLKSQAALASRPISSPSDFGSAPDPQR